MSFLLNWDDPRADRITLMPDHNKKTKKTQAETTACHLCAQALYYS
jgi:hypothetical protein